MPTIRKQYAKMRPNEVCPCDENMELETPVKYKKCCMREVHRKEQQRAVLMNGMRRIAAERKRLAASIQHDLDHPIILPDSQQPGPKIILP
jgi:hypothetical protein